LGLRACATEIIWFFNSDSAVERITPTAENRVRRWRSVHPFLTGMMVSAAPGTSDNFVARSTVLHKKHCFNAIKPLPSPVYVWHWYCLFTNWMPSSGLKIRWGFKSVVE
jgi:hypothetical protein